MMNLATEGYRYQKSPKNCPSSKEKLTRVPALNEFRHDKSIKTRNLGLMNKWAANDLRQQKFYTTIAFRLIKTIAMNDFRQKN